MQHTQHVEIRAEEGGVLPKLRVEAGQVEDLLAGRNDQLDLLAPDNRLDGIGERLRREAAVGP